MARGYIMGLGSRIYDREEERRKGERERSGKIMRGREQEVDVIYRESTGEVSGQRKEDEAVERKETRR